ncbi:hypothetical protein ACE6H2_011041 [Prunus campanulata]
MWEAPVTFGSVKNVLRHGEAPIAKPMESASVKDCAILKNDTTKEVGFEMRYEVGMKRKGDGTNVVLAHYVSGAIIEIPTAQSGSGLGWEIDRSNSKTESSSNPLKATIPMDLEIKLNKGTCKPILRRLEMEFEEALTSKDDAGVSSADGLKSFNTGGGEGSGEEIVKGIRNNGVTNDGAQCTTAPK